MLRILFLCLALIACRILLPGQPMLSGIVIDSTDRQPVPFATVYFDGTTNGQTTDENGRFALPLEGVELPAVLVVSHIAYAPLTLEVDRAAEELMLVLKPRSQTVSMVVVEDRNQRQENLLEFRRLFLGEDAWGRNARIRNEEALFFTRDYVEREVEVRSDYMKRLLTQQAGRSNARWSPDGRTMIYDKALNFKATAKAPLIIDLPDLGYTLQLDLVSFQADYEQGSTSYLGYYFFQPQEGAGGEPNARRRQNRERAYYNSPQHFLRALFTGALAENGFRIMEEVRQEGGKRSSPEVFDPAPFLHRVNEDLTAIRGLNGRSFILLYYGDGKGRPLPEARWKGARPIQSGLHFGEDECFIRADGTVGDSRLLFSGSMGGRGVAWMLPGDY